MRRAGRPALPPAYDRSGPSGTSPDATLQWRAVGHGDQAPGTPDDVAVAAPFLATCGDFMAGSIVVVDGGLTLS